ncbi:MAG: tyrosine-type recombinase/integrase [Actinomycetota bacterium]|nr:tyrosine-type recombinase/integrase [Actinomycetota bacterium]
MLCIVVSPSSGGTARSGRADRTGPAQIIANAGLRKIRLHDLRHTHASLALKAGVPVKVISERLGHESPAFTLKQYAHVIPGMQAEAAAQVAAMVDHQRPAVS